MLSLSSSHVPPSLFTVRTGIEVERSSYLYRQRIDAEIRSTRLHHTVFHLITYLIAAGVIDSQYTYRDFDSYIVLSEYAYAWHKCERSLLYGLVSSELVITFHFPFLGLAVCSGSPDLREDRKAPAVGNGRPPTERLSATKYDT